MRFVSFLIIFPTTSLMSASLIRHGTSAINLDMRDLGEALLQRSPADNPSASTRTSPPERITKSDPGLLATGGTDTVVALKKVKDKGSPSPKGEMPSMALADDTLSAFRRRPRAKGVVQAAYPAEGAMRSAQHGTWKTKPTLHKPNAMGKIKHDEAVCLGGSCSGPGGIVTVDAIGKKVVSTIDTRAGGNAHFADHVSLTSPPQWTEYGPDQNLKLTTAAQGDQLVRHHVRLEGAGKIKTEGSMSIEKRNVLLTL